MKTSIVVIIGSIALASCANGEHSPVNPEPELARRLYFDTNQLKSLLSGFRFARYHDGNRGLRRRLMADGTVDALWLLAWFRADEYVPGAKIDSVANIAVLYRFDGTVVLSEMPYYQSGTVSQRDTITGEHWGIAMLSASGREGYGWQPGPALGDAYPYRPRLQDAYASLIHWGVATRVFARGDTAFTATGLRHPMPGDTITVSPIIRIEVIDSGILEENWIAAFGAPPDVLRFPP